MKRLQILLEDDLADALDRRSAAEGASKAALIRRYLRDALQPLPPLGEDPLAGMIGCDEFEAADVDDVVYR